MSSSTRASENKPPARTLASTNNRDTHTTNNANTADTTNMLSTPLKGRVCTRIPRLSAWRAAHSERSINGNAGAQTPKDKTIQTTNHEGDRADNRDKGHDLASVASGDPFETPAKYKMTIR
ncbi:hypothetical protein CKAH01_13323 [Colletotrichum kahawae]|uniref:Uncharacterized protein n=1 Tax=Colletotrichum kahawae TaxID=34407 RepID=A0AAD9YNE8_COLKA|nr:hypothetical protein CKAH01_13323 [Colletotrichum kahawae]